MKFKRRMKQEIKALRAEVAELNKIVGSLADENQRLNTLASEAIRRTDPPVSGRTVIGMTFPTARKHD